MRHKRRRVQGDVRVSRKKRALAAIDDKEWVEEVSEAEASLSGEPEEEAGAEDSEALSEEPDEESYKT